MDLCGNDQPVNGRKQNRLGSPHQYFEWSDPNIQIVDVVEEQEVVNDL